MTVDLNKYTGFEIPELEVKKVYNNKEDYKIMDKFNQFMVKVHHDYSTKEKRSHISAKNLILLQQV